MNYFTDENTGEVYAYDDTQLLFVERINALISIMNKSNYPMFSLILTRKLKRCEK